MFYVSVTYIVNEWTSPMEDHLMLWRSFAENNGLKKHVLVRIGYLGLAAISLITSALDTIIGIGAGIATLCTLGKHQKIFKFALNHLRGSERFLVRPYLKLLQVINPSYKFGVFSGAQEGFLAPFFIDHLKDKARKCYNSENFFKRYAVSRLTYALLAISCLVTRVVDGLIALPMTVLSLITMGKVEALNLLTYQVLHGPSIISDLFYCTWKIANPLAGVQ